MQDGQNGMPDFAENPQSVSEAVPPVEKIRCHPVMVVEFALQGLIFGIIVAYVAGAFLADYPEIPNLCFRHSAGSVSGILHLNRLLALEKNHGHFHGKRNDRRS